MPLIVDTICNNIMSVKNHLIRSGVPEPNLIIYISEPMYLELLRGHSWDREFTSIMGCPIYRVTDHNHGYQIGYLPHESDLLILQPKGEVVNPPSNKNPKVILRKK